jgi:hypothetical protein
MSGDITQGQGGYVNPGEPIVAQPDGGGFLSSIGEVVAEVAHSVGDAVGHVVEAMHDSTTTPAEAAMEDVHHVQEMQVDFMQALAQNDVDNAMNIAAQMESTLDHGVEHLSDPNFAQAHHEDAQVTTHDAAADGSQFGGHDTL